MHDGDFCTDFLCLVCLVSSLSAAIQVVFPHVVLFSPIVALLHIQYENQPFVSGAVQCSSSSPITLSLALSAAAQTVFSQPLSFSHFVYAHQPVQSQSIVYMHLPPLLVILLSLLLFEGLLVLHLTSSERGKFLRLLLKFDYNSFPSLLFSLVCYVLFVLFQFLIFTLIPKSLW